MEKLPSLAGDNHAIKLRPWSEGRSKWLRQHGYEDAADGNMILKLGS
jgi:hypothetical protein